MRHAGLGWVAVLSLCACQAEGVPGDAEVGAASAALFSGSSTTVTEATVYEDATGNNGGSYSEICIGNLASTASTRRAYIQYSLPSIPAGSTVTRVRLTFAQELVRRINGPKSGNLILNRVLSSWTQGAGGGFTRSCGGGSNVAGVDWAGPPSVSGTQSGLQFLSTADGASIVLDTAVGTDDDQLIADVQAWVNGSSNFGWRVRISEEATADNARSIRPGALEIWWTRSNGGACTQDDDCTSNNCVHSDGQNCGGRAGCVCCNAATCGDVCESCHLAGSVGTCSARSAATVCRSPSCTAGVASLQTSCNGVSHSCPAAATQDCTPYFCSGNACGTSCATSAQCEPAYFCAAPNCTAIGNECLDGLDDCVAIATCNDPSTALGDWTCTCPSGYVGDGRGGRGRTGCTDVNECATGTAGCDRNATCTNTAGGFTCACNGPQWVGNGFMCMDYNECADPVYTSQCDTNATCQNLVPGFRCVCAPGYTGDGFDCQEIDECARGTDDCHANATCTNTPGSFSCACVAGYMGDGRACMDVDECADPVFVAGCSANATCRNLPGSAECNCNAGYTGDGATCTNIDECATGTDNCDVNATCTDTDGSFTCACNEHFTGTGIFCDDVDECTAGTDTCSGTEDCVNVVGAPFECVCRSGFTRLEPGGPCVRACGDGVRARGEACDDGNADDGDGCSSRCNVEVGWDCFELASETSECEYVCGNGIVNASEECDDATANSDSEPDVCRTTCLSARCGDGVVDGGETCDDGDGNDDGEPDACRTTCDAAYCGDRVVDTGETCDPGGFEAGEAPAGTCTTGCAQDLGVAPFDAGPDAGADGEPASGCGCRTAGEPADARWPLALLALVGFARRRRR